MKREISLKTKKFLIRLALNETKTAESIIKNLPFKSRVNTWGKEIYFTIPVSAKLEKGVEIVEVGTVAYWPPGSALCIFFGKTPASVGEKPQAVSPVTIIGSIKDIKDIENLKQINNGEEIEVNK
ncbi:MAG: hypothetical protein FJW69_01215 [Actinobacteria bacterium]|nr:hypothetical protein [Actinomycetota bacterium]MBM3712252.1 hypothetical protein [Actinomycetota bacterium]